MSDKYKYYLSMVWLPMLLIIISALWGSVCAGRMSDSQCGNLSGYLSEFFKAVPESGSDILTGAIKKHIIIWSIIMISGWMIPGFLLNMAAICERGFILGYTSAGFFRVYGLKGIAVCGTLVPEMLLYIPILTVFSSISLKMSFSSRENKKVFWGKYILISIFFLSVFCAVSVFQSFITTIFMQWVSKLL